MGAADTSTYSGAREILAKYNLTPSKRFGQNFLTDRHVLAKIAGAAELSPNDFVLEIGGGIGALTAELAKSAGHVTTVELDKRLADVLRDIFGDTPNVSVVQGDIMKLDLAELIAGHEGGRVKIAANLPYYITTPVIMRILESRLPVERATVMVQKEVAERLGAKPGSKSYGAVSVAVAYYAECELNAIVPRNCFLPRPEVDSAVITLKIHGSPKVKVTDEKLLFGCVKAAFGQRRKTLANGLSVMKELTGSKEDIIGAIRACGFREDVRGESLGIEDFARLADALVIMALLTKRENQTL